ncbi:MAG TPA: amidohydrolase family protein [Clostridia bacterium]|nr:amidohydrolase family protein [Clostridia bacterium]
MLEALKGTVIHAPKLGEIEVFEDAYLLARDGAVEGVFPVLPEGCVPERLNDFTGKLIIPAFTDLHLHAPQYAMLGMGMDLPLIEWLNTYTFKTEALFADPAFARSVYGILANNLIRLGTTRVSIYASIHRQSAHILMEELERVGVTGLVGKVNMDRNTAPELTETVEESLSETRRFIEECRKRKYRHLSPILTPRFTPSCSDALLEGLAKIADEYGVPIQSHLSENDVEIELVRKLCPDCPQYWESYAKRGLWRGNTIMAHCVHSDERERAAIKQAGVWVAHCPDSNTNIYSGVAPVRRMLNEGIRVALGSDIAGGAKLSMFHGMGEAIRASKLRYFYSGKNEEDRFLTVAEAFYLATSAGAQYFGAGPGFQKGDMLHAVVLSDEMLPPSRKLVTRERLERLIYADDPRSVKAVWSEGIRRV